MPSRVMTPPTLIGMTFLKVVLLALGQSGKQRAMDFQSKVGTNACEISGSFRRCLRSWDIRRRARWRSRLLSRGQRTRGREHRQQESV